jgi:hypothetical protein
VIAMHGWSGTAAGWEPWRQEAQARGWQWRSAERGYGAAPPFLPAWGPDGLKVLITHSMGAHLLPPSLLAEAERVVLLAGFGRFGQIATRLLTANDFKVVLLAGIFVYAFFRFTWCIRQYSVGVLLVAAAPEAASITDDAQRQAFADRAGRVMGLAAESFNDGLRAYYLSFAAVSWFVSPWAMLAATATVIWVLYRREFRSAVLQALESP